MCLAVPGKITVIETESGLGRSGQVDFGGVRRNVNLACVPEAGEGDFVLVHAGVAIGKVSESEALRTLTLIKEMTESNQG